ncbi:MAG TPA: ATP-NAD kinase family protein [Thermoleophilia bacterium]|nr:ATP-NAD kinase family protein [Thermoleophilia bacterium]HQJ97807.1 ATP-NAD kinase family protein [Thermoleophilia bacterium]
MKRLGVIVNPVAGIGGRVGLKGSDGTEVVRQALERGATREAPHRAQLALERLARLKDEIEVLTGPGEMGEDEARAAGLEPTTVGSLAGRPTFAAWAGEHRGGRTRAEVAGSADVVGSAEVAGSADVTGRAQVPGEDFVLTTAADTEETARALEAAGVDVILFAGGDGTARNVYHAVGDRVPVIGVPAGVKIHSAVYATTPAAAGDVVALYLHDRPSSVHLRECEVMDIDEEAFRADRVSARLYGYMRVPVARGLVQSAKAGGVAGEESALHDVAMDVIQQMEPGELQIIGPGTTTRTILDRLGLPATLLGVDAVIDGELVAGDATEKDLLDLLERCDRARIIVTAIGGQGHIFGRGNQQISPAVIRRVGRDRILVIATQTKLLSLDGRPLLVDTGDPDLDTELCGYVKVTTGLGERIMYRVST